MHEQQLQQRQLRQQKPLTYLRQVMALLLDPGLLASDGHGCYPPDVVAKARRLLAGFPGASVGSYTHTGGQLPVREECAAYMARRDGLPCSVDEVQVTSGSVEAIGLLLESFGRRLPVPAGALVPAPGCRLYAAFAEQVGVRPTPYRVRAEAGWQLEEAELELAYQTAQSASEPRILVLINPGSPAGRPLSAASLQAAACFAHRRRLFVIADETLQPLVGGDADGASGFVAFRRAVSELGGLAASLEAASLASLSKGLVGEAGLRAGFCQLANLHPAASAGLMAVLACSCPPVLGQAALAAALTPPSPGDASYAAYAAEAAAGEAAARRKARLATDFLAGLPGFSFPDEVGGGGSYSWSRHVYPRVDLPVGLVPTAATSGDFQDLVAAPEAADAAYCRLLLERTGVAVEPGTAFGQPAGSYHIRISTQPSEEDLMADLSLLKEFHLDLLRSIQQ